MGSSPTIDDIIGRKTRFFLSCPLSVSKLAMSAQNTTSSLRPVNWEVLEKQPPYELGLNLTEFCNSACTFCCYTTSEPRYQMSNDTFMKAITEYHDAGGRIVRLNAMTGEPLLDPGLFEKMAYLRSLGDFDQVHITTNAILLSKEGMVESLLASGVTDVEISTGGFDRSTYEKVMGVKKYDEFLAGLLRLLEANRDAGHPVAINIAVRGLTEAVDHEDFWQKVYPYIASSNGRVTVRFLRLYLDWIGRVKEEDLPDNCGLMPKNRLMTKPCLTSFLLCVRANGDLRICTCNWGRKGRSDELAVGNIDKDALMDVWTSDATAQARRTTYGRNCCGTCGRCLYYMPISMSRGRWNFP